MSDLAAPAQIRFQRPLLPDASHIDYYFELSRHARWFSNGGPCWHLLRDRLADRVGAYCVPVASGTLGLMAAIGAVLSDRGGEQVGAGALMPSFTFPATAQAALWCGLKPRLIDVDSSHWHLDPALLESALRREAADTSVVLAVSTFGTPPPAAVRLRWQSACRSARVPLIVDSAAGFGAIADDETPIGTQGDVEVVSFHATKPFAIGEGGAVFTRNRTLRDRIELTINFGLAANRSVGLARGLNGKMSELHAATGLAVLDEFDQILELRRAAATSIRAHAPRDLIWQDGCERSTWQFLPVVFPDSESRAEASHTHRGRVELRTYYEPLHQMAPFRHLPMAEGDLLRTVELHDRILCLPMANDLTDVEMHTIAAVLEPTREASTGAPPITK